MPASPSCHVRPGVRAHANVSSKLQGSLGAAGGGSETGEAELTLGRKEAKMLGVEQKEARLIFGLESAAAFYSRGFRDGFSIPTSLANNTRRSSTGDELGRRLGGFRKVVVGREGGERARGGTGGTMRENGEGEG